MRLGPVLIPDSPTCLILANVKRADTSTSLQWACTFMLVLLHAFNHDEKCTCPLAQGEKQIPKTKLHTTYSLALETDKPRQESWLSTELWTHQEIKWLMCSAVQIVWGCPITLLSDIGCVGMVVTQHYWSTRQQIQMSMTKAILQVERIVWDHSV